MKQSNASSALNVIDNCIEWIHWMWNFNLAECFDVCHLCENKRYDVIKPCCNLLFDSNSIILLIICCSGCCWSVWDIFKVHYGLIIWWIQEYWGIYGWFFKNIKTVSLKNLCHKYSFIFVVVVCRNVQNRFYFTLKLHTFDGINVFCFKSLLRDFWLSVNNVMKLLYFILQIASSQVPNL